DFDQVGAAGLGRGAPVESESFTDRVLVAVEGTREGLIDDRDLWRASVVSRCERAAGEQRDSHGFEEVFANLVDVDVAVGLDLGARGGGGSGNKAVAIALPAGKQRHPREGDRADAGHRLEGVGELRV